VVSVAEQRMRVYEYGALLHDWPVSTGIAKSPTHTGVFQILSQEENAYASLWDLWMPHFQAIYAAGPDFYNGIHGLPTLSSGRRLWEGLLGSGLLWLSSSTWKRPRRCISGPSAVWSGRGVTSGTIGVSTKTPQIAHANGVSPGSIHTCARLAGSVTSHAAHAKVYQALYF
jgi:hypothetical protein